MCGAPAHRPVAWASKQHLPVGAVLKPRGSRPGSLLRGGIFGAQSCISSSTVATSDSKTAQEFLVVIDDGLSLFSFFFLLSKSWIWFQATLCLLSCCGCKHLGKGDAAAPALFSGLCLMRGLSVGCLQDFPRRWLMRKPLNHVESSKSNCATRLDGSWLRHSSQTLRLGNNRERYLEKYTIKLGSWAYSRWGLPNHGVMVETIRT